MNSAKLKLTAIFILLTIAIAACGQNDNINLIYVDGEYLQEVNLEIWYHSHDNISDLFAPIFEMGNPHININARTFNNLTDYTDQLNISLMAGTGPDLFMHRSYADPNFIRFMADWFPIMQSQPNFNEDNYFMNVFHASSFQGALYGFPTHFNMGLLAANTSVPGLSDLLGQRSEVGINAKDLIDIAQSINSDFYIHQTFDDIGVTIPNIFSGGYILNFMDIESGMVDLSNPQFINLITTAKSLSTPSITFERGIHINSSEREVLLSQQYLFAFYTPNMPQYLLNIGNLRFSGHIPLVSHRGEIIIEPFAPWALNANTTPKQRQAAWEFIYFMQNPDFVPILGTNQPMIPTYKPLMRSVFRQNIPNDPAINANNWDFVGTRHEAIDNGIAILESFADMPMLDTRAAIPEPITMAIYEIMMQFQEGFITAEQAAENLQNRITLIFMELN